MAVTKDYMIRLMYERGDSVEEISAVLGICTKSVRRRLSNRLGYSVIGERRRLPNELVKAVRIYRSMGFTIDETVNAIQDAIGVRISRESVMKYAGGRV